MEGPLSAVVAPLWEVENDGTEGRSEGSGAAMQKWNGAVLDCIVLRQTNICTNKHHNTHTYTHTHMHNHMSQKLFVVTWTPTIQL